MTGRDSGTILMEELKLQEEKLFNCVHCGFCLPACPTYVRLGDEADSPRGRLHFMRAMVDGRVDPASATLNRHLDRCLGCRACESVCPSGVEYGHLLEGAREVTARARPQGLLTRLLPSVMAKPALAGPAMLLTRIFRATGIPGLLARRLPGEGWLGQLRLGMGMVAATKRPQLPVGLSVTSHGGSSGQSTEDGVVTGPGSSHGGDQATPASLGGGARTAVLLGCVQEGLLGRVNRATVRVLEANGYGVMEAPGQSCCGAIHAHTGELAGARRLARENIRAFEEAGVEVVAVNAAGCGAIMKEYGHLLARDEDWRERAEAMAARVKDVSELLGRPGVRTGAPLPLRVTYDAPCHLLHAQRIATEPIELLKAIPGIELIPLEGLDECCGGAGIYGITHPELGGRIGADKVRAVMATGADVVVTPNPGCMMQIGAGLRMAGSAMQVAHPLELLEESYRRGGVFLEPDTRRGR